MNARESLDCYVYTHARSLHARSRLAAYANFTELFFNEASTRKPVSGTIPALLFISFFLAFFFQATALSSPPHSPTRNLRGTLSNVAKGESASL